MKVSLIFIRNDVYWSNSDGAPEKCIQLQTAHHLIDVQAVTTAQQDED
jgi:hypothetical protein